MLQFSRLESPRGQVGSNQRVLNYLQRARLFRGHMIWLPPSPRQARLETHWKTEKERQLADWRGGWGGGWSQIIRRYISFNTLWVKLRTSTAGNVSMPPPSHSVKQLKIKQIFEKTSVLQQAFIFILYTIACLWGCMVNSFLVKFITQYCFLCVNLQSITSISDSIIQFNKL